MVLPLSNTQKFTQASPPISTLKSRQDITAILRRHYPESTLSLNFQHVRSTDQMTIAKPSVLVFPLVAKNHANPSTRPDGNAAKVSCHWYVKTMLLGFYDPRKIEICVALSVKIHIKSIQHHCAPLGNPYGVTRKSTRNHLP